ncbi:MAG: cytochrome c [Bdellovibrionales bacterium]|nr:cytochrome c [Bdellovibrionales bacterium]
MSQKSSAFKSAIVFGVVALAVVLYFLHLYSDDSAEPTPAITEVKDSAAAGTAAAPEPATPEKLWLSSAELVGKGQEAFQRNCAVCHGKEGKGDGPAAKGLVPPPRNLVDGKWKQGGTTQELFVTLKKGIAGTSMPGFPQISKQERWALVHFIRSVTTDRPADNAEALEKFALAEGD